MKQITLSVFAIATLIAGPVMAQSVVKPGVVGHHVSSGGRSAGCVETMSDMAQHVDDRMAMMRAKLKITDKQMPQWNAFADTMRANARRMIEMHRKMDQAASMSAPDRLDQTEKMTAGMMKAVQSSKAAFMPLYSVLSPEQKKTVDTMAPVGFGWG